MDQGENVKGEGELSASQERQQALRDQWVGHLEQIVSKILASAAAQKEVDEYILRRVEHVFQLLGQLHAMPAGFEQIREVARQVAASEAQRQIIKWAKGA